MKSDIHPQVHKDAKVTCTACHAVFLIPGTEKDLQIEVCSNCHPVYTGKYRGVTSSGRVERFQKKMASAEKAKTQARPKKKRLTAEQKMEMKAKEKAAEIAAKKEEKAEKVRAKKVKEAKKTVTKKATKKKKKS